MPGFSINERGLSDDEIDKLCGGSIGLEDERSVSSQHALQFRDHC